MKLTVWQDASCLYALTCRTFFSLPFELKKVASQQIAAVDSIHRNIAEGYGRRSLKEYLNFLNIALGSSAEAVSGLHVYRDAGQIQGDSFDSLDALAYKLENGLIRLIESLQARQQDNKPWQDRFILKESNQAYGNPDITEV